MPNQREQKNETPNNSYNVNNNCYMCDTLKVQSFNNLNSASNFLNEPKLSNKIKNKTFLKSENNFQKSFTALTSRVNMEYEEYVKQEDLIELRPLSYSKNSFKSVSFLTNNSDLLRIDSKSFRNR